MKMIFLGLPGEGIPGIPGRDLTPEEVKKFGKKFLLDTGKYKMESKKRENKALKGPDENKEN